MRRDCDRLGAALSPAAAKVALSCGRSGPLRPVGATLSPDVAKVALSVGEWAVATGWGATLSPDVAKLALSVGDGLVSRCQFVTSSRNRGWSARKRDGNTLTHRERRSPPVAATCRLVVADCGRVCARCGPVSPVAPLLGANLLPRREIVAS